MAQLKDTKIFGSLVVDNDLNVLGGTITINDNEIVKSINGKRGDVTLTPDDVGAVPISNGAAIIQSNGTPSLELRYGTATDSNSDWLIANSSGSLTISRKSSSDIWKTKLTVSDGTTNIHNTLNINGNKIADTNGYLYDNKQRVYSPTNKPTPADIGAVEIKTNNESERVVYGINSNSSTPVLFKASTTTLANSVAMRDENGCLSVGTATGDTHAITKKQFDDNTVKLSGNQTINGNKTFSGSTVLNGTTTFNNNVLIKNVSMTYNQETLSLDITFQPS